MSKKDIEIVIGAKNEASKILEQVSEDTGELSVNLAKSADDSDQATRQIHVGFTGLAEVVAVTGVAIGAAIVSIKAVTAAATAAANAVAGFSKSVTAFTERARAVGIASEAEVQFANSLKESTNASVESTLATLEHAQALGMTEGAAIRATTIATGLSRAVGVDQKAAVQALRDAMLGNADALSRMIPGMELANTHAERMALVNANAQRGMALLKNEADDSIGIAKQLASAYGSLNRVVGEAMAPVFDAARESMRGLINEISDTAKPAVKEFTQSFQNLSPVFGAVRDAMKAAGVVIGVAIASIARVASSMVESLSAVFGVVPGLAGTLVDVFKSVAQGVIAGITVLEVAFTNIPTIIDIAVTESLLFLEGLRADIEQILTVSIPAYATWFAENFTSLLGDAFDAVATAFANLAIKMQDIGQSLIDYLKSGMTDGALDLGLAVSRALSGGLLEGFEAQTQALPEIAERAQTATEKMLEERSSRIAGTLTDQFNETYKKNIEGLNRIGALELDIKVPDLSSLNIGAVRFAEPVQATESRLQTRGYVEDPFEQALLKNAEEQLKAQKRAADELKAFNEEQRRLKNSSAQPPIIVGTVQ